MLGWPALSHQTRCSHGLNIRKILRGCLRGGTSVHHGLMCQIDIVNCRWVQLSKQRLWKYTCGKDKSQRRSNELQYVWVGEVKTPHRQKFTFHIKYLVLQAEVGTDSLKGLLSVKTEGFYIENNLLSSLKLIAIPSTIIPPSSLPQFFHWSFLSCCCSAALTLCNTYSLSPPAHFLHVRYIELSLIGICVRKTRETG